MNIFAIHSNPVLAGTMLPDKLTVKMVLETAQMLSTAVRTHGANDDRLYKVAHLNHPCSIWARQTKRNFIWLYDHGKSIAAEYTKRYGKQHKSEAIIDLCAGFVRFIPDGDLIDHPQCMPDEFKDEYYANAYRKYVKSKSYFTDGFRKGRDFSFYYLNC